jgi:hypothetical protein
MDFWENFWGLLWFTCWFYVVISLVGVLFWVFGDLFRDKTLNGWFKALWVIGLLFLPGISLVVYLVARGSGMAERNEKHVNTRHGAQAAPSRSPGGVSDEIAKAQALLEAGSITAEEYEHLKERALIA